MGDGKTETEVGRNDNGARNQGAEEAERVKTTTTKDSPPYATELTTPTISSAKRKKIVVWSAMFQNRVYTTVTKSVTKG